MQYRGMTLNKLNKQITILREEATLALVGFHTGPLSWSNWNLEILLFVEEGKPEDPEKNPRRKARTSNKLNLHMAPGRNRTRATLVGGERSHHCAIPVPQRKRRREVDRTEGTTRDSIPGFVSTMNATDFRGRNYIVLEHIHIMKKDTHV